MKYTSLILALIIVLASTGLTYAVDFYLRAEAVDKIMPDGTIVPMWGYALDPDDQQETGQVTVPGPRLVIPPGESTLNIHLKNRLDVDTSIIIPTLPQAMTPQRFPAGDADYPNRIRSFTVNAPPGNLVPVTYTWNNVRPGSFIYQSGTHVAVQVQMGLYGPVTKDDDDGAYSADSQHDHEVVIFYSEIDPMAHAMIDSGNYGPGEMMTSTIEYKPEYFLVNGTAYSVGEAPIAAGEQGQTVLLRLFNAGLETHVAQLQNLRGTLIADDGWPLNYPVDQYAFVLQAGKTKDVLLNPTAAGSYAVFDRRLRLTNANASPGGLLSFLEVATLDAQNIGAVVDTSKLALMLEHWLQPCQDCGADLNGDNFVNLVDFSILIAGPLESE